MVTRPATVQMETGWSWSLRRGRHMVMRPATLQMEPGRSSSIRRGSAMVMRPTTRQKEIIPAVFPAVYFVDGVKYFSIYLSYDHFDPFDCVSFYFKCSVAYYSSCVYVCTVLMLS